jgi:hypothetical protein
VYRPSLARQRGFFQPARRTGLFPEFLSRNKVILVSQWLETALQPYAESTRRFLLLEKDPFRNPVGHSLRVGLPLLLEAILDGRELREAAPALDTILRIRAVQDFSATEAVSFILSLKEVLRHALNAGGERDKNDHLLMPLFTRIEDMARLAHQMFMQCREQIGTIQSNETKRRFFVAARMAMNRLSS